MGTEVDSSSYTSRSMASALGLGHPRQDTPGDTQRLVRLEKLAVHAGGTVMAEATAIVKGLRKMGRRPARQYCIRPDTHEKSYEKYECFAVYAVCFAETLTNYIVNRPRLRVPLDLANPTPDKWAPMTPPPMTADGDYVDWKRLGQLLAPISGDPGDPKDGLGAKLYRYAFSGGQVRSAFPAAYYTVALEIRQIELGSGLLYLSHEAFDQWATNMCSLWAHLERTKQITAEQCHAAHGRLVQCRRDATRVVERKRQED